MTFFQIQIQIKLVIYKINYLYIIKFGKYKYILYT